MDSEPPAPPVGATTIRRPLPSTARGLPSGRRAPGGPARRGRPVQRDALYVDEVSSFEFAALVAPDGLVREYELTYVATAGDERVRVVRTVRWSDVGNATVATADWHETARERVGA